MRSCGWTCTRPAPSISRLPWQERLEDFSVRGWELLGARASLSCHSYHCISLASRVRWTQAVGWGQSYRLKLTVFTLHVGIRALIFYAKSYTWISRFKDPVRIEASLCMTFISSHLIVYHSLLFVSWYILDACSLPTPFDFWTWNISTRQYFSRNVMRHQVMLFFLFHNRYLRMRAMILLNYWNLYRVLLEN